MFPMITERGNTSSLPCKPETGEITLMPHCHQVKFIGAISLSQINDTGEYILYIYYRCEMFCIKGK